MTAALKIPCPVQYSHVGFSVDSRRVYVRMDDGRDKVLELDKHWPRPLLGDVNAHAGYICCTPGHLTGDNGQTVRYRREYDSDRAHAAKTAEVPEMPEMPKGMRVATQAELDRWMCNHPSESCVGFYDWNAAVYVSVVKSEGTERKQA